MLALQKFRINLTDEGKQLLLRIASILTKLIERFDFSSSTVREETDQGAFEDEDEDENEHEQP